MGSNPTVANLKHRSLKQIRFDKLRTGGVNHSTNHSFSGMMLIMDNIQELIIAGHTTYPRTGRAQRAGIDQEVAVGDFPDLAQCGESRTARSDNGHIDMIPHGYNPIFSRTIKSSTMTAATGRMTAQGLRTGRTSIKVLSPRSPTFRMRPLSFG